MRRVATAIAVALLAGASLSPWWLAGPAPVTQPAAGDAQRVAGGDGGAWPRATPAEEGFSATALEAAAALAAEQGIGSLLVARHGHLVLGYHASAAAAAALVGSPEWTAAALALAGGLRADPAAPSPAGTATALSQQLWQPLDAHDARWREGLLLARAEDWLRVGVALAAAGRFAGNALASPAQLAGIEYLTEAAGAEPFATRDLRFLAGPQRSRLWLVPALQIVIVQVAGAAGANGWDETQMPNIVVRAVEDLTTPVAGAGDDAAALRALVPGH